jgi:hypothetical protein
MSLSENDTLPVTIMPLLHRPVSSPEGKTNHSLKLNEFLRSSWAIA